MNDTGEKIPEMKTEVELEMISRGNTAEICQLEGERVLKLFREGIPLKMVQHEFLTSCRVRECFSETPQAYELVHVKERFGIVYEQIHGTDLMSTVLRHPMRIRRFCRLFAKMHARIHSASGEKLNEA